MLKPLKFQQRSVVAQLQRCSRRRPETSLPIIGPSFTTRGSLHTTTLPWVSWRSEYDQGGAAIWMGNNVNPNAYVSSTRSTATNYAAPDMITTGNSLNTSMTWRQSLQPVETTGPNSENTITLYDSTSRPSQKISPYGAYTNFSYSVSAPQITANRNGRTTKSYLDGLGRPAHIDKSDSNSTQSIVQSVYDSCGCSATGKLVKQSLPYAPGATLGYDTYVNQNFPDSLPTLGTRISNVLCDSNAIA